MGAQWKHSGRIENSSKRGAIISKLVKEIIVATKVGGANPEGNARLRAAIEAAKKSSVPRDNIDRAIKKGSGQLDDGVQIEMVTYEGFAPHQVPVIVECLTENRNRTASDIRQLFRNAQLGNTGSVAWMFDRVGLREAAKHARQPIDAAASQNENRKI
jgi:YebC/PmpR family DNA-binding regulatory protein